MAKRSSYTGVGGSGDSSNPDWMPPAWLGTEHSSTAPSMEGNHSASRRKKNSPYFSVPMKAVPAAVRQAMEEKLTGLGQYSKEKKHIHQLTAKLSDQKYRLAALQSKIVALEQEKERGLKDIRINQEEKMQKSLEKLEKDMRLQFQKERDDRDQAWKQALDDEFSERKRQRQEQYKLEDDEADRKRSALEDSVADSAKNSETVQMLEKVANERREELALQQAKLDGLHETRSEIVWLLKQVIKAEDKNKVKKDATKSPPRTTIPK
jgi:hypothetical protein